MDTEKCAVIGIFVVLAILSVQVPACVRNDRKSLMECIDKTQKPLECHQVIR